MNKILELTKKETERQQNTLMMIPSENYTYPEVRAVVGSPLMHKYSEGYAGKRYYQGNEFVDEIERSAIESAKSLFGVPHANVQPYSGSPANSEVLMALVNPGEKIMGLKLDAGGHLTHGHPKITFSGKYYESVQFGVDESGLLDYEKIAEQVKAENPKLLLVGTTAYPMIFDWGKFAEIAESVGAWLVADISHIAGLVAAGVYPSPVPHAHVVTSTTHKTLRGPRGAMILVTDKGLAKDEKLAGKIDRGVFPGMQGGPHNNTTAGIAITLENAANSDFKTYAENVVANAKILSDELMKGGLKLHGSGTECHLMVVDLVEKGLSGNVVAIALEAAGIVANRNSVPNDPMPPFFPSGVRLGTPALTVRGMGEDEMKKIAGWIIEIVNHVSGEKLPSDKSDRRKFIAAYKKKAASDEKFAKIKEEVEKLCKEFPIDLE